MNNELKRPSSPFFPSSLRLLALILVLGAISGCSKIVSSATNSFADALSAGILNQDDMRIVQDGAPAYLLLVDGFIAENPDNEALLLAGADLYSSYAGAFVTDPERAKRLAARGKEYGQRAVCARSESLCQALGKPYEAFAEALDEVGEDDLNALYGFSASWSTWIQVNEGDWNAVAELPKVEAAMRCVVKADPAFRDGWPYLYLGTLNTLLPPAYGGKPEEGRAYFEKALELSERRNLLVQVMFAQRYARLVFDQELHDQLLREVLDAPTEAPMLTLINTLAKQQAEELLAESNEYF